jgi:serine/threonine-protein kinase
VVTQIARGGMATVWVAWRARRDGTREVIALKTLLPNLCQDQSFVHMFLDEARLLSEIHHPNVVGIRDVGIHEDVPYVSLEWVEGDSLAALCACSRARARTFRSVSRSGSWERAAWACTTRTSSATRTASS